MSSVWTITPHAIATLPVPGWECLFGRNDCSLHNLTFWIWVLRCGDQVALIDTGLPAGSDLEALDQANQGVDPKCVFTPHQTLTQILEKEQIPASAVRFVLISQLVTYSTGGLAARSFPNATFYCAWQGMSELLTQSPGHPPKEFYFTADSWNSLRDLLIEGRIVFAQGSIEVAPGLLYEPTGGHHPGSAGVQVKTGAGVVGILETAFVQENVEKEIPIGIAENTAECRYVIRRYRKECALTLAGHEPSADQLLQSFLRQS